MKNDSTSTLRTFLLADSPGGILRPSVVVGIIYIALIAFVALLNHYSALDFAHVGTVWSEHDPAGTWGYDGQYYYQIARNPLEAYQYMDNAPFREQHIFYPLVVGALSLGQTVLIPYMLLFVNVLSVILSVELLARLLSRQGLSPWFSLAIGLYFGQAAGTLFDTAEPFTYFLVLTGIWLAWEKKPVALTALLFGLAALTREIAILFPIAYICIAFVRKQWSAVVQYIALGMLPLVVLLVALRLTFGQTGVTFTRPFEHIPFADVFYYMDTPKKFYLILLLMFLPTVAGWLLAFRESFRILFVRKEPFFQRFSPAYLFLLANLVLITFMSHSSFMDLVSCGRIATGLVLSVLVYALSIKDRRVLWIAQFYTLTFLIYIVGTSLRWPSFLA